MEKRKKNERFAYTVLGALVGLFALMVAALVFLDVKAEVITLVGGWGGTLLTLIGAIVAYEFGSSKGSQAKDDLLARKTGDGNAATQNIDADVVVTGGASVDGVRNDGTAKSN